MLFSFVRLWGTGAAWPTVLPAVGSPQVADRWCRPAAPLPGLPARSVGECALPLGGGLLPLPALLMRQLLVLRACKHSLGVAEWR